MEEQEFFERVSEFIAQVHAANGEPLTTAIKPDDNLFDMGLVNSFTIIRTIVFVQELTGANVDVADYELDTFYTLRGLYDVVSGANSTAGAGTP